MKNFKKISETQVCKIAYDAHYGVFRRDGKTPYINHPKAVAEKVRHLGEDYVFVALLHDVVEDTHLTKDTLIEMGIPIKVINAVVVLTKNNHEDYQIYLNRIKRNKIAKEVKIADMLHNLSESPTRKQIKKYAKGLIFLLDDGEQNNQ